MAENNHQTGRSLATQTGGHPNDPRLRKTVINSVTTTPLCRDFIRGCCNKFMWCKFRHVWDATEVIEKNILKFCHDFQNKGHCFMPNCSFLHISNVEEKLFRACGRIPEVLAKRYATMMVPTLSDTAFAPPLPPSPVVNMYAALPPTSIVGLTSSNMVYTAPTAPMVPMTQMLLPPPPPPPPLTTPISSSGSAIVPVSHSTAVISNDATYQSKAAMMLMTMFDASQPPPPRPAHIQEKGKNKLMDAIEAGPSKIRKPDESKGPSDLCYSCLKRQIRITQYKEDVKKLLREDRLRNLAYKKKLQALEKAKELRRARVTNKLNQILDNLW